MKLTTRAGFNVNDTFPFNYLDEEQTDFDFDEVFKTLQRYPSETTPPGIHMNDISTYDIKDIARLFELISDLYEDDPWVQTDPTTITDVYARLLADYDVGVNVVTDGPSHLSNEDVFQETWSDGTPTGDLGVIERLSNGGLDPKVVLVLHSAHTNPENHTVLREWMKDLSDKDVTGSVDPAIPRIGSPIVEEFASPEKLVGLYTKMWSWIRDYNMVWGPHSHIGAFLQDNEPSRETIHGDIGPFVEGEPFVIKQNGFLTTSKRRHHDDEDIIPRYSVGKNVRTQSLKRVSLDNGGCRSCEWWDFCKGGDTVHGLRTDWRHRTVFCKPLQELYSMISNDMNAIDPALIGDAQ